MLVIKPQHYQNVWNTAKVRKMVRGKYTWLNCKQKKRETNNTQGTEYLFEAEKQKANKSQRIQRTKTYIDVSKYKSKINDTENENIYSSNKQQESTLKNKCPFW